MSPEFLEISIDERKASFTVKTTEHERSYKGEHGLTADGLEELADLRRTATPSEYGEELFRALFKEGLSEGFAAARQEMRGGRANWRIRLKIDPDATKLHPLWWECLRDPDSREVRLATSSSSTLCRYLESGGRVSERERLKVLVVISNPADLGQGQWKNVEQLDEDGELKVITEALEPYGDRLSLEVQNAPANIQKIRRRLWDEGFNILHIVSHGSFANVDGREQGALLLETLDQKAVPIGEVGISKLVGGIDSLQLVVMAACHSAATSDAEAFVGLAPKVVGMGVPAVVAMQDDVAESIARTFTKQFYESLGRRADDGGYVDVAVNAARDAIHFVRIDEGGQLEAEHESWDWAIPVLYMRGDGRLFVPSGDPAAEGASGNQPNITHLPGGGSAARPADPVVTGIPKPSEFWFDALTSEPGLERGELKIMSRILVGTEFDDIDGEDDRDRIWILVTQCLEEGREADLRKRYDAALKLREIGLRQQDAQAVKSARAKLVDLDGFRTERAS